ncbi:MAG: hypothetical protein DDT18_01940 [Actinobacteria bacterium]|nr:hypothetical protein [Actinomycetota bacterium]
MAPLSVLPGRIRFESPDIIGKFKASEYLEREILEFDGVLEASVNHRTGRILVKFNENLADRITMTKGIKEIIKNMPDEQLKIPPHPPLAKGGRGDLAGAGLFKHALIDAVAHALLPKPLNIILPLAISSIKR